MKFLKMLIFIGVLSLSGLYCNSGGDFDAAGIGGPNITPENSLISGSDQQADGDDKEIVQENEDSNNAGDEANDLANGTDDNDSVDGVESSDDIAGTNSSSNEGDVKVSKMTTSLDSSQGRWSVAEKKPLTTYTKEEYNGYVAQIKSFRNKIKENRLLIKSVKLDSLLSKEDKKEKLTTLRLNIKEIRKNIKIVRETIGFGRHQRGIYSPWAKQPLYLNITDAEKTGWYRLRIVAKNIKGPLPDFYENFNITVMNETTGKDAGGLFIKASDKVYQAGSTLVYVEKGDSQLSLVWTNDAWKKDLYDANIQIKRVTLRYAKAVNNRKRFVKTAHQYSVADGRFFWDSESVRTYWANQTIGFNFPTLKSGKYKVIVVAKNYGTLPPDYTHFEVAVDADGVDGLAKIKANKNYKRGAVTLDLTGGNTDVYLTWKNDKYKKNVYDANIQIKKIILKRVGDSERSAISAYLLGTKTGGNRMLVFGALLTIIIALGGLFLYNRKKVKA